MLSGTVFTLHGWLSPDGMEELLAADIEGKNERLKNMPYDLLTDKNGLNLRPYQLSAIKAAEEAIISGKQTALLAMATGERVIIVIPHESTVNTRTLAA